MTWWLRSCPRCGGDLYGEAHSKHDDIVCVQCGAVFYPEALFESLRTSQRPEKELVKQASKKVVLSRGLNGVKRSKE
jgi:transcription initiation factor TFIIIB Brf1 subunit/transcription initiation factor TFIIB